MGDANNPKPSARPSIQYVAGGYAIVDAYGKPLTEVHHRKDKLHARLERLIAEADAQARRGPRACMCCQRSFVSEGIHNRLCNFCRRRSNEAEGVRPVIPRKHGRTA